MTTERAVVLLNVLWLLVIVACVGSALAVASWARTEHVAPHPIVYVTPGPFPGAIYGPIGPTPTPHP